ncbi:MAG TPA: phospho-N-acetylmuramoyl-pentapeptide-transferase [Syntrophorhabdaceae bacterium]|nr:phospho-N-acetylmuramoyl-pentapeptide-transferase [Syntrophorhabdaceae bacterium]HPU30183.1 phospho-N-acetylmuramoyl-pentapeptide-transferase [Syntrophorhabdaceae bacterium]
MLYHLLYPLYVKFSLFNVFRYITFRTVLAILTALIISFILTPYIIKKFHEWKIKSDKREDVPERHTMKQGTPTMGGFVILVATIIPTFLWSDLRNNYIWIVIFGLLSFGAIGFADDIKKLSSKNGKGITGKTKMTFQMIFASIISVLIYLNPGFITQLTVPFFKNIAPDLGIFYIILAVFIIVGTSNAVNLTDGLDGLAIGPVITVCATFMLFSYLVGNIKFAQYLQIFYVKGAGELTILCGAMLGAGIGFLWYNAHPAELFMGDTGSLSLGATLATIAVIIKQEILLVIVGGIFVLETISVIIQVLSFKWRGKRVFKMAPIHHHYELKGWNEEKIVVRFWIVSIILALLALSTLKLR